MTSGGRTQRAVLDTSVVIADDVPPIPGTLAISATTVAELQFGVMVARTAEIRARSAYDA